MSPRRSSSNLRSLCLPPHLPEPDSVVERARLAGLREDPQRYRSRARQLVGVRQFRNDQDTVDHALQRGRERATDALERLQQDAEGLVNDGHRQRFVGVEVVVQSPFGHPARSTMSPRPVLLQPPSLTSSTAASMILPRVTSEWPCRVTGVLSVHSTRVPLARRRTNNFAGEPPVASNGNQAGSRCGDTFPNATTVRRWTN